MINFKEKMHIQFDRKRRGTPTLEVRPGHNHDGLIIGSSDNVNRSRLAVDSASVYFDRIGGDDASGNGTIGNPYQTYNRAAQDVDTIPGKDVATQLDSNDLDLSGEPLVVPVQTNPGIIANLTAASNFSKSTVNPIAWVNIDNRPINSFSNGNTIVMVTPDPSTSIRSTDGGETWSLINDFTNAIQMLNVFYAGGIWIATATGPGGGTNGYVYRSDDDGANWSETAEANVTTAIGGSASGIWYRAIGQSGGVPAYRSTDFGATWTPIAVAVLPATLGFIHRIFNIGGSNWVALVRDTNVPNACFIYGSDDDCLTWSLVHSFSDLENASRFSYEPSSQKFIASNSIDLEIGISDDNGASWSDINAGTPTINGFIENHIRDGFYYVVSAQAGGGIYKSSDGVSWVFVPSIISDNSTIGDTLTSNNDGILVIGGRNPSQTDAVTYLLYQSYINDVCGYNIVFSGSLDFRMLNNTFQGSSYGIFNTAVVELCSCSSVTSFISNASEFQSNSLGANSSIELRGYTSLVTFDNNLVGNILSNSGTEINLTNSSALPSSGKSVQSSIPTTLNKFDARSVDDEAIRVTSNGAKFYHVIAQSDLNSGYSIFIDGFAAASKDIALEFVVTKNRGVFFNNGGGSGLELIINSSLEGDVEAANSVDFVKFESGNHYNGARDNVQASADVFSLDPLFIDSTYKIQRESGYPQFNISAFDFDSFLVGKAIESVNQVTSHLTSQGNPKDVNAWSFDDSNVNEEFTQSFYVQRPWTRNALRALRQNTSVEQFDVNGGFEVINDPKRRSQGWFFTYGTLSESEIAKFRRIEALEDMTVYVSFKPDVQFEIQDLVVDGDQSQNAFSVRINASVVFPGAVLVVSGKVYTVSYPFPSSSAATDLILDRPLEDDILDSDLIKQRFPVGDGVYEFKPVAQENLEVEIPDFNDLKRGYAFTLKRSSNA